MPIILQAIWLLSSKLSLLADNKHSYFYLLRQKKMKGITLEPTIDNSYIIVYDAPNSPDDFAVALNRSQQMEIDGDIEGACNTRYQAFQRLAELIPDDQEITLQWEDENSQNALLLIYYCSIDHFLVGDFEMSAAMLEMLLDLDGEDHLEATKSLAYTYVALGEYELFDEIINDISDKYADKEVLKLWSDYRRNGAFHEGELIHFKKSFSVYYKEFCAEEHAADQAYLKEIESERPSREALAREMWLQTEHLWTLFPGFIEELRKG